MEKTILVNLKMSREEKEKIREKAKKHGLSISAYLRMAALTLHEEYADQKALVKK